MACLLHRKRLTHKEIKVFIK
ncbi:RepB family protein (plasmid) [Escherichia coli]